MKLKRKYMPYFFIAPAILVLFFCSIIPILISFGISFTNLSLSGLGDWSKVKFVAFDNFKKLFADAVFVKSISNTFYYVIVGVPLVILVSFLLAMLINTGGRKKIFSFFRAVFYAPSITNMVAISVVWLYLYNPSIGLFNKILNAVNMDSIIWLQDPSIAKNSLLLLSIWRNLGINMLIFLAALQAVPKEIYEASSLDGAGNFVQLFKITIPSVKFSIYFVMVTTLIGWFQYFEEPYIITEGGPLNSTISMAQFIYQSGFYNNRFGYAAAASLVLFIFIFMATLLQQKLQPGKNSKRGAE